MRINKLEPIFLDEIPDKIKEGKLYISKKYGVAILLCACGCLGKTVMPLSKDEWILTGSESEVTLRPSIGNWSYEQPNYHAHYHITNNKIEWC